MPNQKRDIQMLVYFFCCVNILKLRNVLVLTGWKHEVPKVFQFFDGIEFGGLFVNANLSENRYDCIL
jgi:hypothetical protein